MRGDGSSLLSLLKERPQDINAFNRHGVSPLHALYAGWRCYKSASPAEFEGEENEGGVALVRNPEEESKELKGESPNSAADENQENKMEDKGEELAKEGVDGQEEGAAPVIEVKRENSMSDWAVAASILLEGGPNPHLMTSQQHSYSYHQSHFALTSKPNIEPDQGADTHAKDAMSRQAFDCAVGTLPKRLIVDERLRRRYLMPIERNWESFGKTSAEYTYNVKLSTK